MATLTPEQEAVLIAERGFLTLRLLRSVLHCILKQREVPTLVELARQDVSSDKRPRHKPFKNYTPGYVRIDIKLLPQMPDEEQKRYLYMAIGRVTCWIYLEVRRSHSAQNAQAFRQRVAVSISKSGDRQWEVLHGSLGPCR